MHKFTPIAAASVLAIAGLAGIAYSADDDVKTGTTSTTGGYGTTGKGGAYGGGPTSTATGKGTGTMGTSTSGAMGTGTTLGTGTMGTSTSGTLGTSTVGTGAVGTSPSSTGGALGTGGGPQSCPNDDASKTQSVLSFLHDANQNAIKEGKLAQTKATNPTVKDFASSLVKDHTDADTKLTDLAKKQNIDLARGTPVDPIRLAVTATADANDATLRGKTGKAFDFAFIGPQVNEHTLVMKVIDEGLKSTKDADTKKFLNDARAGIAMHQQQAAKIQDQLATGTTTTPVGGGPTPGKKDDSGGMKENPGGTKTPGANY